MDQEGAASSAPDEGPPVDTAVHSDVVSGNATVEPGDEQTVVETPENPVCDTVKEEEIDFNPEEENDIVEEFLGVEVETLDLLDIGESGQPSSSTLPAGQGAAVGAPEIDLLGDVAPLSWTHQQPLQKLQLGHLHQHHRSHQGRGVHAGAKTRSIKITGVSFTRDSND